ncbi:MAG: hypothetical protein KAT05_04390 [Spirochaetes bacterium]|nr:hypothetical protein [Spirochaetota bacterium]
MKRWYDQKDKLGTYLTMFKGMSPKTRDSMAKNIILLIDNNDPEIKSKFVFDFPEKRDLNRRWYDKYDKFHDEWILFNMLPYLDAILLNQITLYLEGELGQINNN